jgi:hypothetical protein
MSPTFLRAASTALALACGACVVVPTPAPTPVTARTVTPTASAAGQAGYCREYKQSVVIGGEMQTAHGTTCLQADGTWKLAGTPAARPAPVRAEPRPSYPPYGYVPYGGPYIVVPVGPATGDANDHGK